MNKNRIKPPQQEQEDKYRFPYHWFPESRLHKYERKEKQRIIYSLIRKFKIVALNEYLDVGCGDGRWTSDIHDFLKMKINAQIITTGIDFSERAITYAKMISPHINFEVHRGEEIPYSDNSFDLLTSIEVLEHVEDESENKFLSELHRVSKNDGLIILTTPSWNLRLPSHHFRHYSIDRLNELAYQNNLSVLDIKGHSLACYGKLKIIRSLMKDVPIFWKIWKPTYREVKLGKALNLIVALRPK